MHKKNRKLCPFDKQECVGTRCMIFDETSEVCTLRKRPPAHTSPRKREPPEKEATDSRYRAHLFE